HHDVDQFLRHVGRRAYGTHSARVRAPVTVQEPLVVARGRQRKHHLAVAERDDRDLAASEALLDEQRRSGLPELVDRGGRRRAVVRDDDSLSRGEAVELDYTGSL